MKKRIILLTAAAIWTGMAVAGNPDRAGQAGATELLVNPWARSSGWFGANSASITGIESMHLNVAGLAFTRKTEVVFAHTNWLGGSGIGINTAGIAQKVGETGTLGISVMSMSFGEIPITTFDLPDGGIGNFKPNYLNIGVSYAKAFSNSIYGGVTVKIVSQNIANLKASGFCFDAGIQYVTTLGDRTKELKKNNLRFGIALRNVGPTMSFSGDGMSLNGTVNATGSSMTLEQRSSNFELPSLLSIGLTYVQRFNPQHSLNISGTFTSNSFSNDNFAGGLEYSWKGILMLRGGYNYQKDITNKEIAHIAYMGPSAGATIEVPITKSRTTDDGRTKGGMTFGIDYSYRATYNFGGIHSFGARINL